MGLSVEYKFVHRPRILIYSKQVCIFHRFREKVAGAKPDVRDSGDRVRMTHLGMESISIGSEESTFATLAYPEEVRVLFAMEVQIAHPCSRHLTSRVARHITNMLSSVCTRVGRRSCFES
jgi:hypothetical protein